jgi:hypothetical protein
MVPLIPASGLGSKSRPPRRTRDPWFYRILGSTSFATIISDASHFVVYLPSNVRRFFRHCPSCGRRFEIKLVGKKLVGDEEIAGDAPSPQVTPMGAWQFGGSDFLASKGMSMLSLEGTDPVVVEAKNFQYTYRCKHCGHTWIEFKVEDHEVGRISQDAVNDMRETGDKDEGDIPGSYR